MTKDCGCHCPGCGKRHTGLCIGGGRCIFCGRALYPVPAKRAVSCATARRSRKLTQA